MKRHMGWLARRFWSALALLCIFTAVVVQLGRELAPVVSDQRQALAGYVSGLLGAEATFESIEANWTGLRPELAFTGFQLQSPVGEQVVEVRQARATVDLLQSLLDWRLRVWQVEFSGVSVHLHQSEEGNWNLKGFTRRKPSSGDLEMGKAEPAELFLAGRLIQLNDIDLHFTFRSGREDQLSLSRMLLQNDGEFHRLQAGLDLPDRPNVISLIYEGTGDPGDWRRFRGNGYLQIDEYPLSASVAFASEQFANQAGISDASVSTKLWLTNRSDAHIGLKGWISYARDGQPKGPWPEEMQVTLDGDWHPQEGWQLQLQQLYAAWQGRQSQSIDLELAGGFERPAIDIRVSNIDLQPLLKRVRAFPELPKAASRILGELNPAGSLQNLHVSVPLDSPKDFLLKANLSQVSVNEWKGAPQIGRLDGYVEAGVTRGFVEIDSRQGFDMHFPKVYRQAFSFEQASGQVGWEVLPDDNQVWVNSGRLELTGELGRANGYFYLDVPLKRDTRPSELILQIGLQDGQVSHHDKLVPYVLPQTLLEWLDKALVGGHLDDGGFVMQGYFGKQASKARSVQLGLNLSDATLDYDSRWPSVKAFDGYVEVDTDEVDARVEGGQFLQASLKPTHVKVTEAAGQVMISGGLNGDAGAALELLTSTPIREALGPAFDSWKLSGRLDADVNLHVPLKAGGRQSQEVTARLDAANLVLTDLDLTIGSIAGDLSYSSARGLTAPKLEASLWEQAFEVVIESQLQEGDAAGLNTKVSFDGMVDFAELAKWIKRPEALFVEGLAPVAGSVAVSVGEDAGVVVSAESDLWGATIDLPAPFGKLPEEGRQLTLQVPVRQAGVEYQLQLDDLVDVHLRQSDNGLRGVIDISAAEPWGEWSDEVESDVAAILLRGYLEATDAEIWWPVIERYETLAQQIKSDEVEDTETEQPLLKLDLRTPSLFWGDWQLQDLQLTGGQMSDGWQMVMAAENVKGDVRWFDGDQPMEIDLDYLELDNPLEETALTDGSLSADASITAEGSFPAEGSISAEDSSPAEGSISAEDSSPAEGSISAEGSFPAEGSISAEAPFPAEGSMPQAEQLAVATGDPEDPLRDYDPTIIPAMNFSVAQLQLGSADYGSWSMQVRPTATGVNVGDIRGAVRGVDVLGHRADSSGAQLTWTKTESLQQTRFRGRFHSEDLVKVSKAWGLPKFLETEEMDLDLDFTWSGSPATVSLAALAGELDVAVDQGRFFRSSGQASNAFLRLVGLFNFDSWVRRLQLDFSDLYKGGMAFDEIEGTMTFDRGKLYMMEPIVVKTPSSKLRMGGQINLQEETLDASLVATLPVGGNATLIAALAAGLPAAAGVYAVSKIFEKQVEKVSSLSYRMEGQWDQPDVRFDRLFDDKAASKAGKSSREESQEEESPPALESGPSPEPESVPAGGEVEPLDSGR